MIGFGQDTVFITQVDTVYITVDNNENSTLNKQSILLDDSKDDTQYSQIIDIHPVSLFFGKIYIAYERKISNKNQSIKIGIPFYLRRDLSKIKLVRNIASFYDLDLYDSDDEANSTLKDILNDAEGLAFFTGYGVNFEYRFYLNKNKKLLTGIYLSPEYSFKKFNIKVDVSASDLENIMQTHNYPSVIDSDIGSYEADAESKINVLGLKLGYQWITESLSFDINIGVGRYSVKYDFEEEITYKWEEWETNNLDGELYYILPKIGFSIGYKF